MEWFEALILGIIQGLTEFLPVSSSGHLELGKVILGVELKENMTFTIVVHGATVLSTVFVFWKDLVRLFKAVFRFTWDEETKYITKLFLSMIPVGILGVLYKDEIESLFTGNILLVGSMLLITAVLLAATNYAKPKKRSLGFWDSIIIGIAQAIATMPGISRSGSTIATGLLLGNKKEEVSRFSFLMVLIPIIAANILDLKDTSLTASSISPITLIIGFIAAFITGVLACKWMIKIVNKGKLIWFAVYCALVGSIAVIYYFV